MLKMSETKWKVQAELEITKAWFLTLGFSKKPETPMFHTSESKKAAAFYLTLFSTLGTICKPAIEIPLSLLQQLKFVEMIFLSTVAMKLFQRSIWNELV